jgi:peptidoglycan/LPS O-acetylase OafA/YrhL
MRAAAAADGAARDRPHGLGYRPALDGIRAMAILAVFAFHTGTPLVGGFIGVDIFFVLSGFLITTLLLQEWSRTNTLRLGHFYRRRARRLLPALFVTIAVVGVIYRLDPQLHQGLGYGSAATIVIFYAGNWVAAFAHNPVKALGLLDHTWSLAIEEQFYILWPLLLLICLRRSWTPLRILSLALAFAVASATLRAALWSAHIGSHVYFRSDTRADGLLLGCALAAAYSSERGPRLLRRYFGGWAVACLAGAALLGFALTYDPNDRFVFVGGLSAVAACSAVIIAHVVVADRSWVTQALSLRPIAWIGARSYGMYLFHIPVIAVIGSAVSGERGLIVVPLELAVTIVAAAASYRWVESYFLRRSPHLAGAPPHVQRVSQQVAG